MVTSGLGLSERRREVGILKATGWQTDEVLLRGTAESLAHGPGRRRGVAGPGLGVARVLGGYGLAAAFLPGLDADPGLRLPYRLTPRRPCWGWCCPWSSS